MEHYEKGNIGMDEDPKLVNIGNWCMEKEKENFITLLHEYKDILSYSYENLKSFHPKEVQDDTPLKFDTAPFRQKKSQYNPRILATIQVEI